MKATVLIIFLILNVLTSSAQTVKDQKLIDSIYIDISHILTLDKIPLSRKCELYLINSILEDIQYSELLYENGIKGLVILNCKLDSLRVINFIEIKKYDHIQLPYEAIAALNCLNQFPISFKICESKTLQLRFKFDIGPKNIKQFKNGTFEIIKEYIPSDLVGKLKK
jgi:hypothetical protein